MLTIDRATNAIQRGIAAGTLEVAAYIQDEYQDLSFVSPDTVPYFTPASAIKWVRLADFPRFPVFSTKLEIDWQFWRVMRKVSPWQACALSLGIDPDSLEESKLSRKWHENGPTFESRSFPSTTAEDEFRKRLRLLNAARSDRAVFTQPMEKYSDLLPGEMLLAEFVAWALAIGLPNLPTELKMVVPKSQEKEEIVNVGQIPDQRVTKHTLKTRRHILDPAIDKAIQNAGSHDTAAVFLSLVELALAEEAPFTGHREGDALFYTDANDKSAKLTKDALSARLRRRIEATDSRQ